MDQKDITIFFTHQKKEIKQNNSKGKESFRSTAKRFFFPGIRFTSENKITTNESTRETNKTPN